MAQIPRTNLIPAKRIILHQYDERDQHKDDIAIIELQESIPESRHEVSPVSLPTNYSDIDVGAEVIMAGWGKNKHALHVSWTPNLLKATVNVMSLEKCAEKIDQFLMHPTQLCTENVRGGTCSVRGTLFICKGLIQRRFLTKNFRS